MLRYYMTPLTREMLIAESKRRVAERVQWRRERDQTSHGEHREFRIVTNTPAPIAAV